MSRPSISVRILVFALVWAAAGYALSHFYVTDACPPEVKAKEARLYGLLAPLSCLGEAGVYTSSSSISALAGWGFLIAFVIIVVGLLKSKSWTWLIWAAGALVLWFDVGLHCAVYSMTHHGP